MAVFPKGDYYNRAGAYFANLKVSATATPSMKVKVTEGSFWQDGITFVQYPGGTSPSILPAVQNAKWVVIIIDRLGNVLLVNGQESNNPVVPPIPESHVPLALVYLDAGVTSISDDMIFEARPFLGASVFSSNHASIKKRDEADCHPITAITGLVNALDIRPTADGLATDLASKSDVDGTSATNFALNKDLTGIANSDCSFTIYRGAEPDVSLTWKEDKECWIVDHDLYIKSSDPVNNIRGVVLTSPNGSKFKIIVADDGTLSTVAIV